MSARALQTYTAFNRALAGDAKARAEALEIALHGWSVWMRCGGSVDLGRCMGLPTTASGKRYAKVRRDFYLVKAFTLVTGPSTPQRCAVLATSARRFMSEIWPRWHELDAPPFGASEIKLNLFLAAKALPERMALSARQIQRIVTSFPQEVSANAMHDQGSKTVLQETFKMPEFNLNLVKGVHYTQGQINEGNLAMLVLTTWKTSPSLRASYGDNLNLFADYANGQARALSGLDPHGVGLVHGVHYSAGHVDHQNVYALVEEQWQKDQAIRQEFVNNKEAFRHFVIAEATALSRKSPPRTGPGPIRRPW